MYEVEEYTTEEGKSPLKERLQSLKDKRLQAKLFIRLDRAQLGNLGDWKQLEKTSGICEMREHSGPGYRMFFKFITKKKILMLTGTAKKDQKRAITKAKEYLSDYERRMKS